VQHPDVVRYLLPQASVPDIQAIPFERSVRILCKAVPIVCPAVVVNAQAAILNAALEHFWFKHAHSCAAGPHPALPQWERVCSPFPLLGKVGMRACGGEG